MKPQLHMYVGRTVLGIEHKPDGEPWQWAIVLEGGVRIVNVSRNETVMPFETIIGQKVKTIVHSQRDTTIHFGGTGKFVHKTERVSLNPTQYAIQDPKYAAEGLVYPQWPEELEEAGISSHPDEGVSAAPDNAEAWNKTRAQYAEAADKRHAQEASEFLDEERK